MSTVNLFLVFFILTAAYCEASKILVVVFIPTRSHVYLVDGVVKHLLNDGHEVTYISTCSFKPASPNLRMIDISANSKAMPDEMYDISSIMHRQFPDYIPLFKLLIKMSTMMFQNENVQRLLNDPKEQFDAVISEWLLTELPAGLAGVYNCPLIWISTFDLHWLVAQLIDQPTNPAYNGHLMSTEMPPFTFWQRVTELYTQLRVQFLRCIYYDKWENDIYEELLAPIIVKRGRQAPSYYDLKYNTSLVLANSHYSLSQPASVPQNYIPVGGYHIDEEVEPLPNDLQKIMDNATNGVIYFSLGSNLKSKDIPKVIKDGLIKMFAELKQTVIWKYEEDLPERPKNVHIMKWAPQQSILSHPNTVLFITHGGLLSTIESVHFGVPIIGIPFFADQFNNIAKVVKRGFARRVLFTQAVAKELKSAIDELITDPRYTEKAKELSSLYHNRIVTPGKEISYWVRHVIQTRGAPLLRSPALDVPFYQKLYLDLLALILLVLFVIVSLLKYLRSTIYSARILNIKKNI